MLSSLSGHSHWPLLISLGSILLLIDLNWTGLFVDFSTYTSVILSSFSNLWKSTYLFLFQKFPIYFFLSYLMLWFQKILKIKSYLSKNKTYRATWNFINWHLKIREYTNRCTHITCWCLIHFWLIFTNNEQFKLSIWILILIALLFLTSQVISMPLNKAMNCIQCNLIFYI